MPAYNERKTIEEIIRRVLAVPNAALPNGSVHDLEVVATDSNGATATTGVTIRVVRPRSVKVTVTSTSLKYTGPSSLATSGSNTLTARLLTKSGAAVVGATVRFTILGQVVTGVTDANGVVHKTATAGPAITVDGGASWTPWYTMPNGEFYFVTTDNQFPYRIYAAQQDSGTVSILSRSDFGGPNSIPIISPLPRTSCSSS